MQSSEIRQQFLHYFKNQGHQYVPSSPLVPTNDATLLFTNAGMVQFKDVFLGVDSLPFKCAVTIQKCMRAGGKHNDLENVGYTARHHTFFEMLGNFSFGDYFKRDAIQYAWEFLTVVLKLPREKLWITVFENDDEAADIWINTIGVNPEQLARCGEKDNFWSMGDTGPCGPCSEIFYDHGPGIEGGPPGSPTADGDRFIEIWNLVFMQFNRNKAGELTPLPRPSVDTGMGLERIAAVMQHVHNNYDIDGFQFIIAAIKQKLPTVDPENSSLKVIADHIRAAAFLIAEGVVPSNEGRGYVLRRIIRRAIRHSHKLNAPHPFFSTLVYPLGQIMETSYPEIINQAKSIEQVLLQEENQFAKTLDLGMKLLHQAIAELKDNQLPGALVFKLYDTYGFPLDLTEDIAREQNLHVDIEGFNQHMSEQRALSQAGSQFTNQDSSLLTLEHQSVFSGYDKHSTPARVIAIVDENNQLIGSLASGESAGIILDESTFYAESGGQVGDKGSLQSDSSVFKVTNTQRVGQAIVHYGELVSGTLSLDDKVESQIDLSRRDAIRLNHTATHLLHAALKQVLGTHVQQKGSLVDADRARFDFSHSSALSLEQLQTIDYLVNEQIRINHAVDTKIMPLEEARATGAAALFGEKYSEEVRVLSLGDFSKELCGGTHAKRTGDIGLFKITAEYGVASGVRRIEFVTGAFALEWVNQQLLSLNKLAAQLKTTPAQLEDKVVQLQLDLKLKEKDLQAMQSSQASQSSQDLLNDVERLGNISLLIKELSGQDMKSLKIILDQLKDQLDSAVIVLYTLEHHKINVVAGVSKSLATRIKAPRLVQTLCGKGGGRDDMAQGGGDAPADLAPKIQAIKDMIME